MVEERGRRARKRRGDEAEAPAPRVQRGKLLGFAVVLVLLLWLGLVNRDSVEVSYIVGDSELPLVLVILVSAVLGAVIGWIVAVARRR